MILKDLLQDSRFTLLNETSTNKEIKNLKCCDLLSWMMAKGEKGTAWITVQTHGNIVAVASLLEFSCIIVPEAIEISSEILEKAHDEDVAVVSTSLDSYEIFKVFYDKGL